MDLIIMVLSFFVCVLSIALVVFVILFLIERKRGNYLRTILHYTGILFGRASNIATTQDARNSLTRMVCDEIRDICEDNPPGQIEGYDNVLHCVYLRMKSLVFEKSKS